MRTKIVASHNQPFDFKILETIQELELECCVVFLLLSIFFSSSFELLILHLGLLGSFTNQTIPLFAF